MTWLVLAALLATPAQSSAPIDGTQTDEADRLYAAREHLPNALDAARRWEARLALDPSDFEAAWKLARACYWIGGHVARSERLPHYERGIDAGRKAVAAAAGRPEGHFWLGADMGAFAEASGLRAGLRYRGAIRRELETALAISPEYDFGAADRALSRWYLKVPSLFGGSKERSLQHLQASLRYDENNAATHYFFGETYLALNRREDARRAFARVLDAPALTDWVPEVNEFKEKARRRLASLR